MVQTERSNSMVNEYIMLFSRGKPETTARIRFGFFIVLPHSIHRSRHRTKKNPLCS